METIIMQLTTAILSTGEPVAEKVVQYYIVAIL